jgi:adenylate cyclase
LLASGVATTLAIALERQAGLDAGQQLLAGCMVLLTAALGGYILRRTTRLVADVSAEQRRRERLGRYFSPEVAAVLAASPEGAAEPQSREVTVLFADLRHFTTLAERLGSREVVALLNDFHTRMVDVVFAFGGTLDKYLGDGLMAYFGAPVPQPDHAARAARVALGMQEALEDANAARAARGEPALRMAIGIHTGPVVLGDVGAPRRQEYTIVGDTVNVAARLQELAKARDVPILVSASTRDRAVQALPFAPAGLASVRGRAGPLEVWLPQTPPASSPPQPVVQPGGVAPVQVAEKS